MNRVHSISPNELHQLMISDDIGVVDVREGAEYRKEHIENAINCPLSEFDVDKISKFQKVVLYCKVGRRSAIACEELWQKNPNIEIFNLEGGIESWRLFKFETVTEDSSVIEGIITRQINVFVGIVTIIGIALAELHHSHWLILPVTLSVLLIAQEITGFPVLKRLVLSMPWNKN